MKKIGLITIGQAPRLDILNDIAPIFGENVELLQRGALDNLTETEIAALAPEEGEMVLVSTLRDGTAVTMAEERIIGLLQTCVEDLESEEAVCILFLCTGDFKDRLTARIPLLYPNRLLAGLLPALCTDRRVTVLVPDEEQEEEAAMQWGSLGLVVQVFSISPYGGTFEDFRRIAERIRKTEGSYVLLDCMGYSSEMKQQIEENSGKIVLLPRVLSAVIAKALLS